MDIYGRQKNMDRVLQVKQVVQTSKIKGSACYLAVFSPGHVPYTSPHFFLTEVESIEEIQGNDDLGIHRFR
jgi:hypothetical protein